MSTIVRYGNPNSTIWSTSGHMIYWLSCVTCGLETPFLSAAGRTGFRNLIAERSHKGHTLRESETECTDKCCVVSATGNL